MEGAQCSTNELNSGNCLEFHSFDTGSSAEHRCRRRGERFSVTMTRPSNAVCQVAKMPGSGSMPPT